MCPGCGQPRHESFDIANEEAYTATVLACHACATKERKAWNDAQNRTSEGPPPAGRYYAVTRDAD